MRDALIPGVTWLSALKNINPNVRNAEIEFARERITTLENYIGAAHVRCDALRVVVPYC